MRPRAALSFAAVLLLSTPVHAQNLTRESLIGTWFGPVRQRTMCPGLQVGTTTMQIALVLGADSSYSDRCKEQGSGEEIYRMNIIPRSQWHLTGDTLWIGRGTKDTAVIMYRITAQGGKLTLVEVLRAQDNTEKNDSLIYLGTYQRADSLPSIPSPPAAIAVSTVKPTDLVGTWEGVADEDLMMLWYPNLVVKHTLTVGPDSTWKNVVTYKDGTTEVSQGHWQRLSENMITWADNSLGLSYRIVLHEQKMSLYEAGSLTQPVEVYTRTAELEQP